MARRANGEGSVYRSTDGSGWIAAVELATGGGGKRVRRRRRAPTRAKARALLREMQKEVATHGHLGDAQRLVGDTIEVYLKMRADKGLAAKTLELERWRAGIVVRGVGNKRVRSLTVADCDAFLRAAAAGELSTNGGADRGRIGTTQLRRVRSFLVRALRNDMRLGFVVRNVAELSEVPTSEVEIWPRRALTGDELERLRSGAAGFVAVLVELLGRYGLRPAEARALTWSAVDWEGGLLSVGPRLNRDNERIGPKTWVATRSLRLSDDTLEILRQWRTEQAEQWAETGAAWVETDLVITTVLGTAVNFYVVPQALQALCERVGVAPAVSPYELRHTAITFQAEAEHSAWAIADWAGTSERMIADVYRHKLMEASPLGPAI
ncbi:MAG: tyrosine-type recombinase/integrase [bacterium]|nr:tyrosine-type recombinase/integrase [bacterium]